MERWKTDAERVRTFDVSTLREPERGAGASVAPAGSRRPRPRVVEVSAVGPKKDPRRE